MSTSATTAKKPLTPEQQAIVDAPVGEGTLAVVNAFAGTGKTTTLVEFANARPDKRILYLCYNSALADEGKKRFDKRIVKVSTIHGMAYSREGGGMGERFGKKLGNLFIRDAMEEIGMRNPVMAKRAIDTVGAWCNSTAPELSGDFVDPLVPSDERGNVLSYAERIWKSMQRTDGGLRMTHDGYLKLWHLTGPIAAGYDMILLDEAQDSNPITSEICNASHERGAGLVLVGDRHQAIYGWRGALNSMEAATERATLNLPLTTSWRFTPYTAALATGLLREYKGERSTVTGMGRGDAGPEGTKALIGRTNAVLIGEALERMGKKERMFWAGTERASEGRSPGDPTIKYNFQAMKDAVTLAYGNSHAVSSIKTPNLRGFNGFEELKQFAESTSDPESKMLVRMVEKHGRQLPAALDELARTAATDARSATISLSSAHRSKGLEWDTSLLLDDFPKQDKFEEWYHEPSKAPVGWREEVNLLYVALTRSKGAVHFRDLGMRNWLEDMAKPGYTRPPYVPKAKQDAEEFQSQSTTNKALRTGRVKI